MDSIHAYQTTTYSHRDVTRLAELIKGGLEVGSALHNGDAVVIRTCKEPDGKGGTFRFLEVAYGNNDSAGREGGNLVSYSFIAPEYFTYSDAMLAASSFVFRLNDHDPRALTGMGKSRHHAVASLMNNTTLYRARSELMSTVFSTSSGTDEGQQRIGQLNALIAAIKAMENQAAEQKPAEDFDALVRAAFRADGLVAAVKVFRNKYSTSLSEARHAVENMMRKEA